MMIERAFMGYKIDERAGHLVVRVCFWCSDRASLEAWVIARGAPMTHGICPQCAERLRNQILGETPSETSVLTH